MCVSDLIRGSTQLSVLLSFVYEVLGRDFSFNAVGIDLSGICVRRFPEFWYAHIVFAMRMLQCL